MSWDLVSTLSHTIYYRFTCEQCGKDSGWAGTQINGIANAADYKHIPSGGSLEAQRLLRIEAFKKLKDNVKQAKLEAEGGKYPFKSNCPYCKKWQTWGLKRVNLPAVVVIIIAAIGVGGSFYLLTDYSETAWLMLGMYLPVLLAAIGVIIWRKKKAAKVENKQKPEINWNEMALMADEVASNFN